MDSKLTAVCGPGTDLTAAPARRAGRRGQRACRKPVAAIAPAVLLLGLSACAPGSGSWRGEGERPSATQVTLGSVEQLVLASGRLRPAEFVDVGAQVSGQLEALHVREGDRVVRGQLLAELDATLAQARLAELEAGLEDLQARLRAKRADVALAWALYQRAEQLYGVDAGSREELELAQANWRVRQAESEALQANVRQAEASLRTARANLDYTRIHAPIDGVVTSIEARVGQTLNAAQQAPRILRIANLDRMRVEAQVAEADVLKLEPGMPARFSPLGRRDLVWEARLEAILPEPEPGIGDIVTYPALFEVDNPQGLLRSQMTVQVEFVAARIDSSVLVPARYLIDRRGQQAEVWVLASDGRPERRTLRLGPSDEVVYAVLDGLELGEWILDPRRLAAHARRSGHGP